jgi:hypothetical protein
MKEKLELLKQIYKSHPERKNTMVLSKDLIKWVYRNRGKYLNFYTLGLHKKGRELNNFLTYPDFLKIKNELDSSYHYPLLEDKLIFDCYLKSFGFPTPEFLGTIENGMFLKSGVRVYKPLEALMDFPLDAYCKLIFSWGGKGIYKLQNPGGKLLINGEEADIGKLKSLLKTEKYILQKTVVQHDQLNKMNPYCVNTIRVITLNDGTNPVVLAAILRLGIDKNIVDNISKGNIAVGVKPDGFLMKYGDSVGYPPVNTTHHPNSKIEFSTFRVPFIDEAKQLCMDIHKTMAYFFMVAWDVAISTKGPLIIEGNPIPDLTPMQSQSNGFNEVFKDYAHRFRDFRKNRQRL